MSVSDQLPENHIEINQGQPNMENAFLSGIKQRLLSFIFRGIWNEEKDDTLVGSLASLFIEQSILYMFHAALHLCLTCFRLFILSLKNASCFKSLFISFCCCTDLFHCLPGSSTSLSRDIFKRVSCGSSPALYMFQAVDVIFEKQKKAACFKISIDFFLLLLQQIVSLSSWFLHPTVFGHLFLNLSFFFLSTSIFFYVRTGMHTLNCISMSSTMAIVLYICCF